MNDVEEMQEILREVIKMTDEERCKLFDSGCFNSILLGYVSILTENQANGQFVTGEMQKILDYVSAADALKAYKG